MEIYIGGCVGYTDKCNSIIRSRKEWTQIISLLIWISFGYIDSIFQISGSVLSFSVGIFGMIWTIYGIMGLMVSKNVVLFSSPMDYVFSGPIRWVQCLITYYYIKKYNKSDSVLKKESRNNKINKIIRGF